MYDERNRRHRLGRSDEQRKSVDWDWGALVTHFIHPTKIEIIEAMLWIGQPMSPADLEKIFDGAPKLGIISYHIKCLANPGVLKCVKTRAVRGATEHFYGLTKLASNG